LPQNARMCSSEETKGRKNQRSFPVSTTHHGRKSGTAKPVKKKKNLPGKGGKVSPINEVNSKGKGENSEERRRKQTAGNTASWNKLRVQKKSNEEKKNGLPVP